jgi:hypothetical protein
MEVLKFKVRRSYRFSRLGIAQVTSALPSVQEIVHFMQVFLGWHRKTLVIIRLVTVHAPETANECGSPIWLTNFRRGQS